MVCRHSLPTGDDLECTKALHPGDYSPAGAPVGREIWATCSNPLEPTTVITRQAPGPCEPHEFEHALLLLLKTQGQDTSALGLR